MAKGEVGFIGLGRMGFPMARNLAAAGWSVHVHDVSPDAAKRAGSVSGITVHPAPREVAPRVSVLFSALPNDEIVLETYLGAVGVLAGARAGLVTCDCSTVTPETSQKIHAAASDRGVTHLDTPMLGSSPQAESGEVFFMVGGERDALATAQPLLDVIGRLTMHVGPSGAGNRIKLLHNALGAVNAVAVAESLALATRLGVDLQTYYEVVRQGGGMAYSTYFDRRAMRLVEDNYDATFTVELMHKDVSLAARLAGADLERMPILKDTLAAYTAARAKWPGQDFSGVTHVVEDRFGLTVGRRRAERRRRGTDMAYDLVIKGGMVVDGTGFSRYRADVAVKDGAIVEIGRVRAAAERTIDADGLVVAPGIIDLHTHYDAQPFWDRLCTSSVWHGVTTALMGNCGLTLAPLRPEHREAMLATFCCVEDLPVRSLSAVLPWTWETFDEYLKAIDIGLGMNLMPLVGHNPLRLSAMDKAAWERPATADEIAVMQNLLAAAMESGAWGWSTTDSPTHAGPKGEPVPTRLAADEERVALGRTLAEFNRGIIEILPKGAAAPTEADHAHLTDVAHASGRPVFFLTFDAAPRSRVEAATREGAQLVALLRAIPFNPRFTLKRTTFFSNLDVWDVVMAKPLEERVAALTDPAKRAELREWADKRQRRRPGVPGRFIKWSSIVVKKAALSNNRALEGRTLAELAAEQGKHVADVMLDLALEEGLDTEFQLQSRPPAEDVALAEFVQTGHAIPSQSDAGAHLNTNFCTAGESSWVLAEWVRERQLLSLEDAIRRYTFQPARIMGLRDRGLVREGLAADLMVFDPATIGVKEDEISRDGPSGTPRRVQGAEGVHHVIVGGKVVLDHGRHTGELPGRVLRAGR